MIIIRVEIEATHTAGAALSPELVADILANEIEAGLRRQLERPDYDVRVEAQVGGVARVVESTFDVKVKRATVASLLPVSPATSTSGS